MDAASLGASRAPDYQMMERTANILLPVSCLERQYGSRIKAVCFTFTIPCNVKRVEQYIEAEVRIFERNYLRCGDIGNYLYKLIVAEISDKPTNLPLYVYNGDNTYERYYNQIPFKFECPLDMIPEAFEKARKVDEIDANITFRNCIFENQRLATIRSIFDQIRTGKVVYSSSIRRYLNNCKNVALRDVLTGMLHERFKWSEEQFVDVISSAGCVGGSVLRSLVQ